MADPAIPGQPGAHRRRYSRTDPLSGGTISGSEVPGFYEVPGFWGSAIIAAMPLYEYDCRDCRKVFEAFVTETRTPACPGCQGINLTKLLSRPGMVGAGSTRSEGQSMPAGSCGAGCGCAH